MQKPKLALLLLMFSIAVTTQEIKSQDYNYPKLNIFSEALDSLRISQNIPGLAAAIVKDQKLVWSAGYGNSHFDTGDGAPFQEVTPDTPFWLASVTKPFLGLLFLQLESEKVIDLDNTINTMPGFPRFCKWLTNSPIVFGKDLHCDRPISLKNILTHTVNGEPGTKFMYNPIMYSRLSRYIEYIYGNPVGHVELGHNKMAQLIQEKILGPAGMTRTMSSLWQRDKSEVFFDMAQGYKYKAGRYYPLLRPERHLAGGAGIVSSVRDLAKFDIALDTKILASNSIMEKLFTPAVAPNGTIQPYAYGWYVQTYKGEKLIWHAGWDEEAGFTALYLKIPERNITFIALANSEGMWWGNPLDKAEVHKSLFAKLFFEYCIPGQFN